jgi:hypothetical protein
MHQMLAQFDRLEIGKSPNKPSERTPIGAVQRRRHVPLAERKPLWQN